MLGRPSTATAQRGANVLGERFYTHAQALAWSQIRAGALRRHDGLLAPVDIRAMRFHTGVN